MLGATQDVFHLVSFQSLPGKPLTYSQLILSQISGLHRMPGDSSTTWLTPPRRGPCLLSWWTSSGSCGRTVEFKPALTELQSSSSMTRHLSKTLGRRGGGVCCHAQEKYHSAFSSRQWALQTHKLNLSLWRHLPVPTSLNSFTMIPFGLGSRRHNIQTRGSA